MENLEQAQTEQTVKRESGLALKGIVEIFYKPAAFFERAKDHPPILVPWIAFFLLIVGVFFMIADLAADLQLKVMSEQLADQGQQALDNLPTREQMRWSVLIFGPLAIMITPLLAAALALFFGNVVMAGRATYKQILSVMIYSEIVFGTGTLLLAPLMVAKGSMKVSISLAAILQDTAIQDPLYVALSKIGAFYIWEIFVIGIGLSVIYGFTRNKGYTLAVLSMGMLSVLHVLSQLVFG